MTSLAEVAGAAKRAFVGFAAFLRIPLAKPSVPEPFETIEDSTPGADAFPEPNAAVLRHGEDEARERVDLRGVLAAVARNRIALAALAGAALLLILLAATTIIVNAPAKPMPAARKATREGAALVRKMIVPPASSLAPRMTMEREGAAAYTLDDAIRLGLDEASIDLAGLSARSDAAIGGLFGTVR